jgi:hypothetical protein
MAPASAKSRLGQKTSGALDALNLGWVNINRGWALVLRDKEGNGEAQHQVIMGAFAGVVGFVGGLRYLDPEIPQLFL